MSKAARPAQFAGEITRYARAKDRRGKAACAICGSNYVTRKPTNDRFISAGCIHGAMPIEASNNARNLCSICTLEQLLRQLFMVNSNSGGKVDEQRVRYLSFYPSYFFTPETRTFVSRVINGLKDIRISDKDLMRLLKEGDNLNSPAFWQRLEPFLMPADKPDSKRVLRFDLHCPPRFP